VTDFSAVQLVRALGHDQRRINEALELFTT
jgi:hypothetical protein